MMTQQYDDVYSIIAGKAGVKYAGIEIEAMRAVTDAYKARDIQRFDQVFSHYHQQLIDDPLIASQLTDLKDSLLEQNLLRLLEPFNRVQLTHLAALIQLPQHTVEQKLSGMILDGKLKGILDQGTGDLIVFEAQQEDERYALGAKIIAECSSIVDRLYVKAKTLRMDPAAITAAAEEKKKKQKDSIAQKDKEKQKDKAAINKESSNTKKF